MPKYVKNGREVFASIKAFKLFYEEQGYTPVKEKQTEPMDPDVNEEDLNETEPMDPSLLDDFTDEEDDEDSTIKVDLSVDSDTPLAARVALLPYDQLKQKAKELGIPKYSQTKFDKLVTLVTEAIEKSNASN